MRQPFLLGAFVYVALVAGRMSDGNALKTTKEGVPFEARPQRAKGNEIATANPIIRAKRVTNDPEDITFWANRGRRGGYHPEIVRDFDYVDNIPDWINNGQGAEEILSDKDKRDDSFNPSDLDKISKECPTGCSNRRRREEIGEPFWGARGRRNDETNIFWGNRGKKSETGPFWGNRGKKESDYRDKKNPVDVPFWGNRGKRDDGPFWGNRGKKSDENNDFNPFWGNRGKKSETEPFWGNRGRRNDPFWGNRGKKEDIEPFWGNRGKKDDIEPFWGNRGKKDELEPFWGNRGKKDDVEPFWGNRGKKDELEPFWGNRGKKDDAEPFWGNRGKKDELEPFWGNRGKKDELEPFWGNRGKRYVLNSDLRMNPLELIDRSKCVSKYFNNGLDRKVGNQSSGQSKMFSNKYGKIADPRENSESRFIINHQDLFDPSDNILIYADDDVNGIPRKNMK